MGLICASISSVLSTVLYVIIAIIVLLLMVLIHEFGHYIVGRLLGFKIDEFSVGFGKAIFSKVNKRGEKISLRIFPLGGYCAFAGEEDDENEKQLAKDEKEIKEEINTEVKTENAQADNLIKEIKAIENNEQVKEHKPYLLFNEQKAWKRMLVFAAGVTFNFLSAVIFSFILLVGFGYDTQQVKALDSKYATLYGDLHQGDIIRQVDGKDVDFAFSGTLTQLLYKQFNEDPNLEFAEATLTVERDGAKLDIIVKMQKETITDNGEEKTVIRNGFTTESYKYGFFEALGRCWEIAFGFAWVVLKGFWQIIVGQVAFSELGGPITTISMISAIAQSNIVNFFILLPLLAANLAVFNFLPIPALDGCHALFTLLEWIFRKPVVSRKIEGYIHFYGLIALLGLVVVADLVHLIVAGFPSI